MMEKKFHNPDAQNQKTITWFCVQQSDSIPFKFKEAVFSESWGSTVDAYAYALEKLSKIPFFYSIYTGVVLTPAGVDGKIKRMWSPEVSYQRRQERITKKLQASDPLFFGQLINDLLKNDPFDLDFYRKRQQEKIEMEISVSATPDKIGNLWINPDASWVMDHDWNAVGKIVQEKMKGNVDRHIYAVFAEVILQEGLIEHVENTQDVYEWCGK